jgi:acyl-CoA dehydrogenase
MPSDRLSAEVAQLLQSQNESRDRLTADIYLPQDTSQALGRLEHALDLVLQTAEIHRKLKAAQAPSSRHGVETGVITPAQAALYETAQAARLDAVQVDSFTLEEYFQSGVDTPQEMLARISGKGRTVPG